MKSGEPFALAGVWENWQDDGPAPSLWSPRLRTSFVRDIHDRMPVIIPPLAYDRGLSTIEPGPARSAGPLPRRADLADPTRMNTPDNDDEHVLDPLERSETSLF